MRNKLKYVWVNLFVFLLVALMAGCGRATQPEATNPVETPTASQTVVIQPTPSATEASAPTQTPTTEIIIESPTAPPPTPRPGLEASEPSSFVQASGQYQLVEFFAFW